MAILNLYLKRRESVSWRVLDDQGVLLHQDSGTYYTLNDVALFLWTSLDGNKQLKEILLEIGDKYEIDQETARKDILEIVADLINEGLVVSDEKPHGNEKVPS